MRKLNDQRRKAIEAGKPDPLSHLGPLEPAEKDKGNIAYKRDEYQEWVEGGGYAGILRRQDEEKQKKIGGVSAVLKEAQKQQFSSVEFAGKSKMRID